MIKKFSVALMTVFTGIVFGQAGNGFGIKGGINFGGMGAYNSGFFANSDGSPISEGSNLELGYHVGVFGKIKFADTYYFRPEVVFTKRQNEYMITSPNDTESLSLSSIDVPLLFGIKISGPVSFFVGPSFHFIIDEQIESPGDLKIIDSNSIMFGINTGIALNIKKFGIDLRYERNFGENLVSFQSDTVTSFFGTIDARAEQIILSLSYSVL